MTVQKTQKYFLAKFYLLDRLNSSQTLELWTGTRTLPSGFAWPGSPWIYGAIIDLSGFGQSIGEVLPKISTGTITLETTRGSYDHNRGVADLLEKYSVLKQKVEIYSFSKAPDVIGELADRELEFIGEVSSLTYSPSARSLSLDIQTVEISSDTPLRRITIENAPDADSRSVGRYLPLVIGKSQVPAYPVGNLNGNQNSYLLTSRWTLPSSSFRSSVINKYFFQQEGEYLQVIIDSSTTGYNSSPGQFERDVLSDITIAAEQGHYDWVRDLDGTQNKVITSAYFTRNLIVGGSDSTTASPTFALEVYQQKGMGENPVSNSPSFTAVIVGDEDTYDTADSSALPPNEFFAGDKYRCQMPFNRPFALTSDRTFLVQRTADNRSFALAGSGWRPYFGAFWDTANLGNVFFSFVRQEDIARSGRDWVKKFNTVPLSGAFGYFFVVLNSVSREIFNENTALESTEIIDGLFFSLSQITDFYIDKQSGYIPGSFNGSTIIYTKKALAGKPEPLDISQLNLICEIEGVRDDLAGTITGTPSQVITRGDDAIKFLWYLMKGDLSQLDTTTFSPSTYIGNISGATEGRQSYRQIFSDLLFNTSSKLLPRRNGDLALWSYGVSQSPSFFIDEADCTLEDWTEEAQESLINRVEFSFDRIAIPLNIEDLQSDASINHLQTYSETDNFSVESFGVRDLADSAIDLNWIREKPQAEKLARFMLETYSNGAIYVTFSVPFWKEDYRAIEIFDIIALNHIDIPSEFGSASSNVAIDTEVGSTAPFGSGFVFRHSNQVFLRIISRSPRLTTNETEASIMFTGKVLRDREFK
jgi:hypothetical protein